MLSKESRKKIVSFLGRCIDLPQYSIAFYINGSIDEIHNYLIDALTNDLYVDETLVLNQLHPETIKLLFGNGSYIIVSSTNNPLCNETTNLIFMDSRIREKYIFGTLKPHIKRYQMDEKNSMINPKPIYINFEEEENNEQD